MKIPILEVMRIKKRSFLRIVEVWNSKETPLVARPLILEVSTQLLEEITKGLASPRCNGPTVIHGRQADAWSPLHRVLEEYLRVA